VVLGRGRQPQLHEDARDVFLDRAKRDEQPLGDRLIRTSLGHQLEHLALARGEVADRVVAAVPADELADDGRIERRAALGHAAHGRGELLDVGDPVLQQVADALGAVRKQLHRVAGLDVLGQDEDARAGVALADLLRGP
jgi:hypothetical protein